MLRPIVFLIAVFMITAFSAQSYASSLSLDAGQKNHGRFELLPTEKGFTAGETARIGVAFTMDENWHIYWRNGGETGLPPTFMWSLPNGFDTPKIEWPVPERIFYDGIVNYGYHDQAVFFANIVVPESYNSAELPIGLNIDWLICRDICIPEYGSANIQLSSDLANPFALDPRVSVHEERLPEKFSGEVAFKAVDSSFDITLRPSRSELYNDIKTASQDENSQIFFAPYDWGFIDLASNADMHFSEDNKAITFKYPRGSRPDDQLDKAEGLIVIQNSTGQRGFEIQNTISTSDTINASETGAYEEIKNVTVTDARHKESLNLGLAIVFAFIGGLILNLMPCVFPILSLKALSLINHADDGQSKALMGGLSYTAGVVSSFIAIAAIMIILQKGGSEIGWGFQLQDRSVLYGLTLLMFAIGLSLTGALKIEQFLPSGLTQIGQKQTEKGGLAGSFFTGLLATVVAAPCTAPFMAGAIGFAATQPPLASLTVFGFLGLGLAAPYLLLTAVPALRQAMPRPGAWMESFRQFLAFPMFATALWLGIILLRQDGYAFTTGLLSAALALSLAVWLMARKPQNIVSIFLKYLLLIASLSFILVAPLFLMPAQMPEVVTHEAKNIGTDKSVHYSFTQDALQDALTQNPNKPVFVYLTADWCITCKVNERRVLSTKRVKKVFNENNVKVFKGDWTKYNADITQYLNSFNRNGVPLYIYYAPADTNGVRPEPKLLPQLLSFGHIENLF